MKLSLVALLLLPGVALADTVTTAGHYFTMFETSSFAPCNSKESGWLESKDRSIAEELTKRYNKACNSTNDNGFCMGVFLKVTGQRSELESYGHMGSYQRKFVVEEIHQVQKKLDKEKECLDSTNTR